MELINNIGKTLRDDLMQQIKAGSRLSIAASCFSIYAFQELKEVLKDIKELRFIFTSPTFTTDKTPKQQLERLKEDVVDLEEMNSGVSIMDLGLNEFRMDLLDYMNSNHDVEHTPFGLHAVVRGNAQTPAGTIFVLKNRTAGVNIDHKNQLHPFYMVYIRDDGEVQVDHLHPKELLDKMRLICKQVSKPDVELCHEFNKETRDGLRMGKYSDLLSKAINSIISVKEQSDVDSFLEGFAGELFEEHYVGLDDFELICFLVIK